MVLALEVENGGSNSAPSCEATRPRFYRRLVLGAVTLALSWLLIILGVSRLQVDLSPFCPRCSNKTRVQILQNYWITNSSHSAEQTLRTETFHATSEASLLQTHAAENDEVDPGGIFLDYPHGSLTRVDEQNPENEKQYREIWRDEGKLTYVAIKDDEPGEKSRKDAFIARLAPFAGIPIPRKHGTTDERWQKLDNFVKSLPSHSFVMLFMEMNEAEKMVERLPKFSTARDKGQGKLPDEFDCNMYITGIFEKSYYYYEAEQFKALRANIWYDRGSQEKERNWVLKLCHDFGQATKWKEITEGTRNYVLGRFSSEKRGFQVHSSFPNDIPKLGKEAKDIIEKDNTKKRSAEGRMIARDGKDKDFKFECGKLKFVKAFSQSDSCQAQPLKVKSPKYSDLTSKFTEDGHFYSSSFHSIETKPNQANISKYSGKTRKPSQVQIMKNSPNELARSLGLPKKFAYEWLHLSAFSFGYLEKGGVQDGKTKRQSPQHKNNLVLGTEAANTRMIIEEDCVKKLVRHFDKHAEVVVIVTARHTKLTDAKEGEHLMYAQWLADTIEYRVQVNFRNDGPIIELPAVTFSPWMTAESTKTELKVEAGLAVKYICLRLEERGSYDLFQELCRIS